MSRKISHTEAQYRKWIKERRGTGEYQDYKPWLTVYDAPSDGRVHRVFSYKSKRTHHLLSDLELSMSICSSGGKMCCKSKEQFPLEREITLELAESTGIKHSKFHCIAKHQRLRAWRIERMARLNEKRTRPLASQLLGFAVKY